LSGSPVEVAPKAILAPGVEVATAGDGFALGFATSDREAAAVSVKAGTLVVTGAAKARSTDPIRRVTPLSKKGGGLSLVVDADRKADRLQGRRVVLTDPPVQLGASGDHLAWARVGGRPSGTIWTIETGGPIDALRGTVDSAGQTVALAFRRGSAILVGTAASSGTLTSRGELSRLEGLGTAVGSPAIATAAGTSLVAWSDRTSSADPWSIRWTTFATGSAPHAAAIFAPPAGGKGGQAMSPSLAALPGGRFLLVWTEGPASGHQVRAVTLGQDGRPIGSPLNVSAEGINAGQGQAVATAEGNGVIAFLQSSSDGFAVAAVSVNCGAR
jgi:hypothetical protein